MVDDTDKDIEDEVVYQGFKMGWKHKAILCAIASSLCGPYITAHEGYILRSARDFGGVWTACSGVTENVIPNHTYTKAECDLMNAQAARAKLDPVAAMISVPIPSPDFLLAHTAFAYNVGLGAYHDSAALRLTNQGKLADGCRAMLHFHSAAGHDCRLDKGKPHGCYGVYQYHIDDMNKCLKGIK